MSKTILVTGANGQLGNALRACAAERGDCVFHFTDADTLDLRDKSRLSAFTQSCRADYILNCAAYTAVDKAEDEAELCMSVNRDAVQNVGEVARAQGIKVIHISTDYVFDGKSTRPYAEDDAVNPQSVYGISKLAGEKALLATCPDAVIIRTAWLYSEYGNNFLKTMIRLGRTRRTVGVVSDQFGSPTYAGDLAEAMLILAHSPVLPPGIYHYSGGGICNWYDFAAKIMALACPDSRVLPLGTHEYPTRAVRPAYSVLNTNKIRQTFGIKIPDWETSLAKAVSRLQSSNIEF
ncbi:MAG: dTDP-4-dehydrorhamnose reductase [Tannerella sp.]|jgi:dTDP-4-dehydrorhamnose reductase|nr:dTDP-4-dehydrorhamnose reductase [Tannerella sp.]